MEKLSDGVVVKNTGSWYSVMDETTGRVVACKIKGKFRLGEIRTTNPISVGDRVDVQINDNEDAVITHIHERKNYIIRRSSNLSKEGHVIAANIDQAFLVVTLDFPKTSVEFIDRFLLTSEAYHIPASIILNKIDRYDESYAPMLAEFHNIYDMAGYDIVEVSARSGVNIDEIKRRMKGRTTLFAGNSGVGKSTLINAIDPTLELRTGEISDYHNRGKHTTTFSEMFPLAEGGFLIDTPGIKGFGLVDIENEEVCRYFPDIFAYAPRCQYYNCTHTHEPSCAVREAVEAGKIHESRYMSYLKILDEDGKYRR